VKKGFYKQLVLVDSSLREFRIVSFKKIRTLFSFSFRGFLELIDRNPSTTTLSIRSPAHV
jgi:hypothetical protein